MSHMRGGHGMHGLIPATGKEWREQRRFTLRHLRDFGFGKSSMEEIIKEEYDDLAASIMERINKGEDELDTSLLFNIAVLNVIWSIVTGKRFERDNPEDMKKIEELAAVFATFGANQLGIAVIGVMPTWMMKIMDPLTNKAAAFFQYISIKVIYF